MPFILEDADRNYVATLNDAQNQYFVSLQSTLPALRTNCAQMSPVTKYVICASAKVTSKLR